MTDPRRPATAAEVEEWKQLGAKWGAEKKLTAKEQRRYDELGKLLTLDPEFWL